jgi:hypothetical protein
LRTAAWYAETNLADQSGAEEVVELFGVDGVVLVAVFSDVGVAARVADDHLIDFIAQGSVEPSGQRAFLEAEVARALDRADQVGQRRDRRRQALAFDELAGGGFDAGVGGSAVCVQCDKVLSAHGASPFVKRFLVHANTRLPRRQRRGPVARVAS